MLNNKWIQILIVAIIIFGICIVAKINFTGSLGSNGIHAAIDRGSSNQQHSHRWETPMLQPEWWNLYTQVLETYARKSVRVEVSPLVPD